METYKYTVRMPKYGNMKEKRENRKEEKSKEKKNIF